MSRVLSGLEPQRVFSIFEDICAIPHGSGNTKKISDYCAGFARSRGLEFYQDSLNNIIINKPASKGYENSAPVVLQGHLDMVCEKDNGVRFDFEKDGLRLKLSGDYVSAEGTTLGGDDGIAVAMALAVLDDDTVKTPPLEVVFTTDEETGMYGAAGLDTAHLAGKRFINVDSENEGVFTVGCAGGCRADIKLQLETENIKSKAYKIEISGLKGGHSGTEIDKGRLNANKMLGLFLSELRGVRISEISGGMKDNAIPVFSSCKVLCDGDVCALAKRFCESNFVSTDPGFSVGVTECTVDTAYTEGSSGKIIGLLAELPCGVQNMSKDIGGLVETSLNLGIMKSNAAVFAVSLSVRSSKQSEKEKLVKKLEQTAKKYSAAFSVRGDYPAWEYRKNSPLRDTMAKVFKDIYGKEPEIEIIHAGLECGLFAEKIKDIDAVSIGPDLFDIHTPRERLSVSSVERTYRYICCVLEALNDR